MDSIPYLAIICPVVTLAVILRRVQRRKEEAKAVNTAFKGKVVWVTGASSGIGRSIALAFASKGAKLVLSARRVTELNAVAKECAVAASKAAGGADLETSAVAKVLQFDLAEKPEALQVKGAEAAALWAAPQVDVLINNGGISSRSPAEETSLEVDTRLMAVDYLAPVAISKGCLQPMLTRRSGHIVVVTSVQGRLAIPFRTSYAAAKHALHGYFESLRSEVADRGVKVTLVVPGYVKTNLSLNAVTGNGGTYAKMDETTAKGMEPDELARRILVAVATEAEEVIAADFKTKAAVIARALCPGLLSSYMKSRAAKGWKELKKE